MFEYMYRLPLEEANKALMMESESFQTNALFDLRACSFVIEMRVFATNQIDYGN
jgi:hypothetical protein